MKDALEVAFATAT